MATKTVSIRIDEDLYRDFCAFASRVYIPVSALVASFAATTVREQRLPFEVGTEVALVGGRGGDDAKSGNGNGDGQKAGD